MLFVLETEADGWMNREGVEYGLYYPDELYPEGAYEAFLGGGVPAVWHIGAEDTQEVRVEMGKLVEGREVWGWSCECCWLGQWRVFEGL